MAQHVADELARKAAGVVGRRRGKHVPAHGIGAEFVDDVPRIDDIALGLGHFFAFAVEDVPQTNHVFEGGTVKQQRRYGVQGIEPAPGLVDGFRDVVGLAGILLEQFFVFEGVVPLCHRHGARVKPAVGHIGDAAHGAVDGIFPGDFVDIGAVQVEVAQ